MMRLGATLPSASREKTARCGRHNSRPKFHRSYVNCNAHGADDSRTRAANDSHGCGVACAVRPKNQNELSPLLATAISSCCSSTSTPIGQFSRCVRPWIVRSGFASGSGCLVETCYSEGGRKCPPTDIAGLDTSSVVS